MTPGGKYRRWDLPLEECRWSTNPDITMIYGPLVAGLILISSIGERAQRVLGVGFGLTVCS